MGNSSDIDISVSNIWQSWRLFRAGKKPSKGIEAFEYNLENNILQLAADLSSGKYKHGRYSQFIVNDNKKRVVTVATVRDRVVHRMIYEYLVGIYDKAFIYDVWSCRPNKGLLGAIKRTQDNMKLYSSGWVWRSDIRKYFDSIDCDVLRRLVTRRATGDIISYLIDETLDSYKKLGRAGIPIGNLTSQIFSNIYLNEFDRYVVHYIRPLGYVRYGDDFILWFQDEVANKSALGYGKQYLLEVLGLMINKAITKSQPTSFKLNYLGVDIWPNGCRLGARMQGIISKRVNSKNYASYCAILSHFGSVGDVSRLRHKLLNMLDTSEI